MDLRRFPNPLNTLMLPDTVETSSTLCLAHHATPRAASEGGLLPPTSSALSTPRAAKLP